MFKRFLFTGAVVGLAIPVVLCYWANAMTIMFGMWQLVLWPSSIMLMATEHPNVESLSWIYMVISVGINCLW